MNEAGLVIEMMMHENDEAVYPDLDVRHGLEELQWIQYQLDMSASVADVAAIEYVDGAMTVHTGKDLKFTALANNTYDLSLAYKVRLDAGAAKPEERTTSSFNRFARAAAMAGAYDRAHGSPVEHAFSVLDSVSSRATQWNIVYDTRDKTIHYRTRANRAVRGIAMSMFDYSCSSQRLFADIEKSASGRADFEAYDPEVNLRLIDEVWSSVAFLQPLPRETRIA
jgi:choloylglycine hydrolase